MPRNPTLDAGPEAGAGSAPPGPVGLNHIVLNVRDLNRYQEGAVVSPKLLQETGYVKKIKDGLRILGQGRLEKKLTVRAHHFSDLARKKIEAAGGTAEVLK